MRLLERLGLATYEQATLPAARGDVAQVSDLPAEVAQAFGINVASERVTRREALSIPSVRRGVQVIAGTISGFPLQSYRIQQGAANRRAAVLPDRVPITRPLLARPDHRITRSEWIRRVVEDLIMTPWSWTYREGKDSDGFPAELRHLEQSRLTVNVAARTIHYDGELLDASRIVRFDSPGNGLLNDGAVTLRTALRLEATVRRYADNDVPLGVLADESEASPSGRNRMTDDDIDALLDRWEIGGKRRTTRYIGRLKYQAVQFDAARIQLAEARQRSDVAIAQLLNLESQQINAPGESSMTYSNAQAVANERLTAVRPYMQAIAERLSMGDVTPTSQTVTFDTTGYLRGTIADAINVGAAAVSAGLLTVDEARARFLDLAPIEKEEADDAQDN